MGKPIASIRLVRYRPDSGFEAIPVQIDRKDKMDRYLFPSDKGFDRPTLALQDQFVFQGQDLGEKAPREAIRNLNTAIEIEVQKDGKKGYGYLGLFAMPPSDRDYIRFEKQKDRVVSDFFSLAGHPENSSFYEELSMGGVDHLDRVKLRATATLMFGKIRIQRTEEDIRGRPTGVVDGPVRVLQRIEYSVRIVSGIHSPTVARVTKSYRAVHEIPNRMSVPFNMDIFFTQMSSMAAFDFAPTISGAKIYCSRCGDGFLVNGKMDSFESTDIGIGSRNFALCSDFGVMVVAVKTTDLVEKLPIRTGGIYLDDQTRVDPPEGFPGCFGWFGYELGDLHKVPKGEYDFNLVLLFPDDGCPQNADLSAVSSRYAGAYDINFSSLPGN